MKKMMKAAVCGLALVASLGLGMIAEAGSIPANKLPLHTYAIRKITCYVSPGGAAKGWIDPGDYVIVTQIRSGWAYGSYPVKNGRIFRWFKADDLINNARFSNQERFSPKNNTYVYKDPSHRTNIGSFWGNEPITVVSDSGNSRQVIYKISGGYKMGWVPYWDCWTQAQAFGSGATTGLTAAIGRVSPSGLYYPLGKKTTFVDNTGEGTPHDYIIAAGTPVYAPADGTIYCYQIVGNYNGKFTTVSYGNVIYWVGNGYGAKFAHLQSFKDFNLKYAGVQNWGSTYKKVANRRNEYIGTRQVKGGEIIGYVGSVGNSSGAHLHCELIKNPNYSNGYMTGSRLNINSYFNQ